MDLSTVAPRIDIQPERPLRVKDGRGQRFAVLAGHVWVTQHRDPRDRVYASGEDFMLDRPGLAVFCALGGAAAIARLS